MQDLFSEFSIDFDIITEKQYIQNNQEEISIIEINDTQKLNMTNALDKEDIDINNIIKQSNKDKQNKNKKGIGVLQTAPIKSSNTFLNVVQNNENKKRADETKKVENTAIEFPYIRTELLTNAEKQLYHFMRNYLDNKEKIVIFPKVRLADIISVDERVTLDKKPLYKIASKHVDYLICKFDTLEVICVVELDDYTHDKTESKERDAFIMEALYRVGIDVIRVKVPIKTICKSDLEGIDEKINTVLAPMCPYCGIKMVPKKSMNRNNRGHRFFSCPNFINGCRHTQNIDEQGEKLP